ncbi:cupredoxin domain-containing protein [Ectopseudomonas guguanensis]|jgi:uncharacterized cupredoxin-like copper-binding protein|uniref:Uncharacterized copper-binding protein, cupredoxin-like subfamily n=1 Tax=Ectopseudomonas guguanensis TaxID=1198456 RepID=A0A1H0QV91_9GAMM|nr:cupredoxin family protein [Pseudomonas guguanensis]SDP21065.1 Uncharacterized copper-binding protein, cupredoxin-like subfamily [Pseudomonas guguanensis]
MKTAQVLVLTLIGLLGSPAALAHSETHERHKAAATIKEQKPWGIAGDAGEVDRTIEIRMTDQMRFTPDRLQVRQGETIRFVHRNDGKILHEFVIGTRETLDEHAEAMLRFPGMEHDEPYMAHVAPGQSGEMIWTFNRAGEFDFACLIAGHYQAGMVGTIQVLAD